MFWKYCDYTSKRGTDFSARSRSSTSYKCPFYGFKNSMGKNGWDVEELKRICAALDHNYDILNPNYFTNCRFAYLDHIKICCYLEHNG